MHKDLSDQDILAGCIKGSAHHQKALVMKYSEYLYAICLRYMGNADDAKDILQDSFIKVFKAINQFDPTRGKIKSWMCKICINTALKKLHKRNIKTPIEDVANIIPMKGSAEDDLQVEYMFVLIKELPEKYRTVFNLYVIEGYSHREISEMLGMKEVTCRSTLSRAKEILRKKITTLKNKEAWI